MARALVGPVVTNPRGAVGDVEFRLVAGRTVVQRKGIPPTHATPPAVRAKNGFRFAARAWRAASPQVRTLLRELGELGAGHPYAPWAATIARGAYSDVWKSRLGRSLPVLGRYIRETGAGAQMSVEWDWTTADGWNSQLLLGWQNSGGGAEAIGWNILDAMTRNVLVGTIPRFLFLVMPTFSPGPNVLTRAGEAIAISRGTVGP